VKLKSLFRSSLVRDSTRAYESADDVLKLEPVANPPGCFSWLPMPARKLEFDERDVLYMERSSRATCRALNFVEVILQSWDTDIMNAMLAQRMKKSVS
jgi:hypothetical protein